MADNDNFIPPTIVLCQFCEFKCGLDSISFTTQSLPKPATASLDTYNGDDCFVPSFRVNNHSRASADLEVCPSDQIFPSSVAHYVSHGSKTHRTFISTPSPPQKDYSAIKNCLYRASNENSEASNILVLSNNTNQMKSSVIFRRFQIKDREARGETRKAWLMMVLSDRFAVLEYVPYLKDMFGEIIKTFCEKSKDVYDSESQTVRQADGLRPLRSLGVLLKFAELPEYLHKKFAQILYSLESKYQPLTVVPPGTVDKLMTMGSSPCFCSPSHTEKPLSPTRDRAETIVEPPPPTFTDITQICDMLCSQDIVLIVQNIVCGNQIVVRGQHPSTLESILSIFTSFLPTNCVTNFGYRDCYEHCYLCKFLALPLDVHVPTSAQILVVNLMSVVEQPRELASFRLELRQVSELHKLMSPLPRIVGEIIDLIGLSKTQESETYSTALSAVIQRWSSKSLSYILAMKTMEDPVSNEAKLLNILQVGENDVLMLRFFNGDLKLQERNRLLKEVQ